MKKRKKKMILRGSFAILSVVFIGFIASIVWNIRLVVVVSDSMNPAIPAGSIAVLNRKVPYEEIKKGDVIAFQISTGQQVTHRVVGKSENGLLTKGDANQLADGTPIQKEYFNGKVLFAVPKVGYWLEIAQSTIAYLADLDMTSQEITNGEIQVELIQTEETSYGLQKSENGIGVALKNNGGNDCYVRVRAVLRNADAWAQVCLEWNEQEFVYCEEDGYYYYKRLLLAGEQIQEALRIFVAEKEAGQELFLYGEACQSAGYQKDAQIWAEFEDYKAAWEYAKQNAE